jgi:hypothetical protein
MPRKEFEAFRRLDASDVNSFLMDQSVMTFGSATARDAAIDTPLQGQVTYLADIDSLSVYNGTQWVTNRPVMNFAGTAARGSAIPTPVTGMTTYLEDTKDLRIYDGSAWIDTAAMTHIRTEIVPASSSNVSLNNIFTSRFTNYQIVMNILGDSAGFSMSARMRLSGTDNTAASYGYQLAISAGTGSSNVRAESVSSARIGGVSNLAWQSMVMSVNNPAVALPTTGFVQSQYYIPLEQELTSFRHLVSTAYDGITFIGGPFRGTISVYGLR